MASNSFSICIPRAVQHVTEDQVTRTFCEFFRSNCVEKVDMVERNDRNTGEPYWMVFVHFNGEEQASAEAIAAAGLMDQKKFITDINANKQCSIVYYKQWFWKCRRNNAARIEKKSTGPRLMTSDDEAQFAEFQKKRAAMLLETAKRAAPSSADTLEGYLAQNPVGRAVNSVSETHSAVDAE